MRRASLILVMTVGILVLTTGVSWARAHGGVAATVAPDGTAVFTTTNGPAPADIKVTVASYTGLWRGQTEPEMLFKVVRGTIPAPPSAAPPPPPPPPPARTPPRPPPPPSARRPAQAPPATHL